MKKVIILLIFVGLGVCAWLLYEPYLKDHVEPIIEKVAGGPKEPEEKNVPKPAPAPKPTEPKSAEPPKKVAAAAKPAPEPEPEPKSEIDLLVEKQYPMPELQPLMVIVDNWNNVPPRAYPAKVVTRDVIGFSIMEGSKVIGSSNLPPGNEVKPERLVGSTLHVSQIRNPSMRTQVDVDKTDFKDQIEKRYNDFVAGLEKRILAMRESAKNRLQDQPDALAAMRSGAKPYTDDGDPRFHPVKASLAAGEVTAFVLEEAVGFHWNGRERISAGKFKGTYDTVTVAYEADTIFGVFPGEMKCLLQNGKVVGWIDPYTMEERI